MADIYGASQVSIYFLDGHLRCFETGRKVRGHAPGQQFVNATDGVVSDALQDMVQVEFQV
jgi:hypothetical protein